MKTEVEALNDKSHEDECYTEVEKICQDLPEVASQVPQPKCMHRVALLDKLHNLWVNGEEVLVARPDNKDFQVTLETNNNQMNNTLNVDCKTTTKMEVPNNSYDSLNVNEGNMTDGYRCDKCGKSFKRMTALKCHSNIHKNDISNNLEPAVNNECIGSCEENCSHCDVKFTKKESKKSQVKVHKSPHKCSICNKEFVHMSKLAQHLSAHSSERPYACDMCPNRYSKSAALQRHLLSHTGERPFKCDQCHLTYRNKESLKQHYLKHSGSDPYQCEHCDLKTFDRGTLMKHMRKHTGERPYICNCCGHGFKTSDTLKMHLRTHTGEKPYKCEICQKSFAYKSNMKSHKKRHSGDRPYKCMSCSQDFVDVTSYKIHMRRHTGEKPYSCKECNKQFAHSSGLYAHLKVHSGQRPFKCNKCEKNFVRAAHLKKHVERIHKISENISFLLTSNDV